MADFQKRGLWLKGIARHLDDEQISDILCNYGNQMINHRHNGRSSFLLGHPSESPDAVGRNDSERSCSDINAKSLEGIEWRVG